MGSLDPQNKILFFLKKKTTIMAKKKAGRGVGKKKNFVINGFKFGPFVWVLFWVGPIKVGWINMFFENKLITTTNLTKYYKTLRKVILRVQLTLINLRNLYCRKENFEGLHGPQNKCSNLILRVKRPLNNLLPRFKRFTFITLNK